MQRKGAFEVDFREFLYFSKQRWASQIAGTESKGVLMGMHGPVGG